MPVADSLDARWWDYVAPASPGVSERLNALLDAAAGSAAALTGPEAVAAGQALERLRISVGTLPSMLATQPPAPPPAPPAADTYTPHAILELDRAARDLESDLQQQRSALAVTERTLRNGRAELDAKFASYVTQSRSTSAHAVAGLQIMALRAEIAVTEAEQRLRQAESAALEMRIRELGALRDRGLTRIIVDPARTPEQIRADIARSEVDLARQREDLLHLRASRSSLSGHPGTSARELELADLRIVAALLDEALLATRIALATTELDWLALATGERPAATAFPVFDRRLAVRREELRRLPAELSEWVTAIQRVLGTSLRTPREQLPANEMQTRAALLETAQGAITKVIRLRSLLADARFGDEVLVNLLAEKSGWGGWLRTQFANPARTFFLRLHEALGTSLFRIGEAPVTAYGLLRVALILLIALGVSRFLRALLGRVRARDAGHQSAGLYTVGRLLHYVLVAAGLLIGLASIGLDFSQVALVAGALSIGIGFGLQSIVNNFVSGLMILFEQNLKVGDAVELDSGVRGVVKEINVRSTLITTNDAVDVVVPNAEFISGKVTNFTLREPYHRIHVPFGVAYGSDKDEVRRVVIEAADKVVFTHRTATRQSDVWLVRFGDNSLDFELVVWINPSAVTRPGAVMATYLWEIETALSRHGIAIPFPQRDVRVRIAADEVPAVSKALATSTVPPAG